MRNDVRTWEQLTVAVLILGVLTMIGSLAVVLVPTTAHVLRLVIGTLTDVPTVLFVVSSLVWRWMTRRLRRTLDDEPRSFAGAWAIAIGVFVVADCAMAKVVGGPDPIHRLTVMAEVVRIIWIALALLVIAAMHRDLRDALAGGPRRDRPTVDEPIRYDTVSTVDLAPADEAFWQAAVAAARKAGADLPLLETTRALERRWLLVPASGDLDALPARLAPDAVLTLFTVPPGSAQLVKPPPATEYYGLIQSGPGGPVRFQLVLPSRVSDFLATAGAAHRAGIYVPSDPSARTAVTPTDPSARTAVTPADQLA
jgi:hypothetical protein